jgi:GH25 family lysozyme M1 (1,4-beta-N-acetylmuramidase)
MAFKNVIDISQWNTITNYATLAKSVDGVILRAAYRGSGTGKMVTDGSFVKNITNLYKLNVPVGIYVFSTALTPAEGAAEADYGINLIQSLKIDVSFPIIIDTEYCNSSHTGRSDKLTKTARTAAILGFCEECVKRGYIPSIYASDSWYSGQLDMSQLTKYGKWVASYGRTPTVVTNSIGWQFTSRATVAGMSAAVDQDHWYLTIGKVFRPVANTATTTTTTTTVKTTTTTNLTDGAAINLKNTGLYASSNATSPVAYKTGTYYIWNKTVVNGKIRITNKASNANKLGMVSGWINVPTTIVKAPVKVVSAAPVQAPLVLSAGKPITLNGDPLYAASASRFTITRKTGIYYIWNPTVINGRVRITNVASNANKMGRITGWVNVKDINN